MKTAKKIFAWLLVASLLAGMLAMSVSAEGGAQIVSQQLSLGDDLTMRFDVAVDSQYRFDAEIDVTVAGKTQTYKVAEMTAGTNGYSVYVALAAPQMNDNIAITVRSGETVLDQGNYSVRAYCLYLLEGAYTDTTKQMAKEVLNYGAKAQVYFDYDKENLANAGYELETQATVPTEGYDMTLEGQVNGIAPYGVTMVLESKIAIRYYFTADDVTGYSFTVGGKPCEVKEKGNLYYVEVPGINPQSYADAVELTVSDGTDSLVVGYSPLSYMVRMSAKADASDNLKVLLNAMYGYYLKAKSFVGIRENDNRPVLPVHIIDNAVVGTWTDAKIGSTSLGPQNAYDGDTATNWNPAVTDFMSGEGIVYTLDNTYDLTNVVLNTHRIYYFDLLGSSDGVNFEQIFRVGSSNAADFYSGEVGSYVCDISELNAVGVKYLKIVFTGCINIDATHVSVYEVELSGKKPVAVDDGRVELDSVIISHAIAGTWANDREGTSASAARTYDGSATTNWNPAVVNWTSGGAIVYALDSLTELTKVTVTFGSRLHYFDVSVSADGVNYTHVARINKDTASKYFNGLVATVDGINTNAKYIRIDFLGTENGTTWINMMEIEAEGKAPVIVDDGRETVGYSIIANSVEGTWEKDRVGDTSVGPEKSYDDDVTTIWNPRATNYKSGEAIVYTLDKAYDLDAVSVTVGSREYYFDLSVSGDGVNYTHVARVNQASMSRYYNGLVATVNGIGASGVKYVKLSFLGANTADNTPFISLADVQFTCKEYAADTSDAVVVTISNYEVVGTWANDRAGSASIGPQNSCDGSLTTNWNPQVTNFKSGEGIIYTLDKAYDLTEIKLTFGTRLHYFDLYVSSDGTTYLPVASITAENAVDYYNNLVATVNNLTNTNIVYIKVMFTGNEAAGNTFINLFESEAAGN